MMKQTVNLITAGTLVFICPFEVVACGYVPAAVGDLALTFGVAFEVAHAETLFKQGKLTAAERAEIKNAFQNVMAIKSILSAKDRWELAFASVGTAVDLISNKDLQLTVGLMNDQAKKTHTLVMMVKKLPKP